MDTFFKQIGPCTLASNDNIDIKLIEKLIEKHILYVGSDAWSNLSLCQDLSKDFVIRHGDNIRWCNLHLNKKIKYNVDDCYDEYKSLSY